MSDKTNAYKQTIDALHQIAAQMFSKVIEEEYSAAREGQLEALTHAARTLRTLSVFDVDTRQGRLQQNNRVDASKVEVIFNGEILSHVTAATEGRQGMALVPVKGRDGQFIVESDGSLRLHVIYGSVQFKYRTPTTTEMISSII